MAILAELSAAVKERRAEMGLSQEQLARLADLSRATVTSLETGRIGNLSLLRAEKLANVLGLGLGVAGARRAKGSRPLESGARIASVSYGQEMSAQVLEDALVNGIIPPGFMPQLRAFLDEAPAGILADIAAELEKRHGIDRRATWQRMRKLASVLQARRDLWQ